MLRSFIFAALVALGAASYRPVVLWHGMGDTCCLPFSMGAVKKEIEKSLPGVFVYSIMLGQNQEEDQLEGFFGNVNKQIDGVCDQIRAQPELAQGFNAIGFSQGGQFLRGMVERCGLPVYNLITFGGQHMGVSEFPHCMATNSTICEDVAKLLALGAYADGVRDVQVQAQYFRSSYNYSVRSEYICYLSAQTYHCRVAWQSHETFPFLCIGLNVNQLNLAWSLRNM
eukprot:TRINITY_DN6827_c0_g1_i4.p1 TRINITY_DN6827_c0_g1~~TRINITY_DN6827_c0_g1_i4.p1  ORF type:complete len:226 (+),score=39.09 TRINITY_DN6827_c0_g1_i4:176-853(+)